MDLTQPGNITFTVSDGKPPRASLLFPQIPTGLFYKKKTGINTPDYLRNPIYFVSTANSSTINDNRLQYEVGQYLEAGEPVALTGDVSEVDAIYSSVHNLNLFDYAEMGLNINEIDSINSNSKQIYLSLNNQFNDSKALLVAQDIDINKYQKTINEIEKTLSAVETMVNNLSPGATREELIKTKDSLIQNLELNKEGQAILLLARDENRLNIKTILEELRKLSTVVK
jgi:hypothetical protein